MLFSNCTGFKPHIDDTIKPSGKRKQLHRSAKNKRAAAPPAAAARRRVKPSAADERLERLARRIAAEIRPATPEETKFRHGHWLEKRAKVNRTLLQINSSQRTVEAFEQCGSECTVEYSASLQKHRVRANHCKNRHCEPCMRARAGRLAANLKAKIEGDQKHRFRFLTLTLRHSDAPLADQIKRLYKSFSKLRATKFWKQSQRGGCFILEVKWSAKSREWHPHLHVITEGNWIKQQTLANQWRTITGDSHVVDVRCLADGKEAAHYVTKYVTKGTSDTVWDDDDAAQEWVTATKGVRTCATYGTWRGYKLLAITESAPDWTPVGTLTHIIHAADQHQPWAMAILQSLRPPGKPNEVSKIATPPHPPN